MPAFRDAFFDVFITENCKKAFKALRLVPIDIAVVFNCFEVQLCTPPAPLPLETPWQSKTPSNMLKFGLQLKLISDSFTRLPVTAQNGFSQLIKSTELMLHQNVL